MSTAAKSLIHPSIISVLSFRNFRFLWFGQIFSQIAINTFIFVLALRLYQQTGSNVFVSGIFLVYGLPAVIFGLLAGTIVDKLQNRTVLFFCDLSRSFLVFLLYFFTTNVTMIYALTFLNAVITQLYVPAEAPAIPYMVPKNQIITANSLFSFTYYSSLAIGSIFAGPFLRVFGPHGIFIFLSCLFLIAAINVRQIPLIAKKQLSDQYFHSYSLGYYFNRVLANMREGIRYVFAVRSLAEALLLLVATQITLAILGTLGPGFADKLLNIDVRDASVLITGPAVTGLIIGALWVGNFGRQYQPKILISRGILIAGGVLLIVALLVRIFSFSFAQPDIVRNLLMTVIFGLFFIFGFANSLLDVPANSILQQEAAGDLRGRIYGILAASVGGIGILPVICGGILADSIGVGNVLLIMGLVIFSYGLWRVFQVSKNSL
ncbi:hypothetical protein A2154_01970 [Candidatus Gottesmanbacteria bacterium RBG_16_43_7]|uniref:Major facilitator superfamily (MFS) profile domain-containing protein n=1 Tax=Candidatus Gottesmanbacteria bacterium RBG_16_43_7 TaxID=1798373 RepID=A0A1F5Z8C6_9BACT|nr:MAG: hypothetical protein A2154_01970 [Candidatus Gottesmanbacteria bacterium RBG_16_43_7]